MHTFTLIFLGFLAASVLTRLWLSWRQINHIKAHQNQVPSAFAEKITLEDHQKAASYSTTKISFGRIGLAWQTLWLLIWTLGGGLSLLNGWWLGLELSTLWTGIAVILSLMLISSLLEIPFSLYSTFVIEEKFGFNKMTLKIWLIDLLKSSLLMLVIGTPLIAAILWLMNQA